MKRTGVIGKHCCVWQGHSFSVLFKETTLRTSYSGATRTREAIQAENKENGEENIRGELGVNA